jgi:hypothetical protein
MSILGFDIVRGAMWKEILHQSLRERRRCPPSHVFSAVRVPEIAESSSYGSTEERQPSALSAG